MQRFWFPRVKSGGGVLSRTFNGNAIIPLEGKSLVPIFRGEQRQGHEALFWEHEGNRAMRMGRWKLVSDHPGPWELYDLEADRVELYNLVQQRPETAREMADKYKAWTRSVGVKPWPFGLMPV